MNKKETDIILQRIQKWYERIQGLIVYDKRKFQAEHGWSKDPVSFDDKASLNYNDISVGDHWGKKWKWVIKHLKK